MQTVLQEAARRATEGDLVAVMLLAAISTLNNPEPPNKPNGGQRVVDLSAYRLKLAA